MDHNSVSSPDICENLDPRVQEELEKLNSTTDEINKLETQLDDAHAAFRAMLSESTHKLHFMKKKLGKCIPKARPYYIAKEEARHAQVDTQKAAIQYQRSNGIHMAAKETIALAEERFLSKKQEWEFDNAWQEMLNHATMKVMEAEAMKRESEAEHQKRAALFTIAENKLQILERRLKRHITKSRPYFERKNILEKNLEMLKDRIHQLQITVMAAKRRYAECLHNLEAISEEIHERRKLCMLKFREPGVGAEIPLELPDIMLEKLDLGENASSTTSELGSEVDFDDDNSSQLTDDPEVETLRQELSELSENMAAAAISINHHTEAYLQKSSLSPNRRSFVWHPEARTLSCDDTKPGINALSSNQSSRGNDIKDEVTSSDIHSPKIEDDSRSFVSVDLND